MQPLGPAAEFRPTDYRSDNAVAVELRLEAQSEWGVDVEVCITNHCNHRLLLPELFVTDLKLGHVPSVRLAEWWSDCLISSVGGEWVLGPGERKSVPWVVRSTRWLNELAIGRDGTVARSLVPAPEELRPWEDQGRFAVDLQPGEYLMWFELNVGEGYFNPRSHASLNDLRRWAVEEHALVWIGAVKSNRVSFLQGGRSFSSSVLTGESPNPSRS